MTEKLLVKKVRELGLDLLVYKWKSCLATVAEGSTTRGKWATIYHIESQEQGKGHATEMLKILKQVYSGWKFGGTVALNERMRHLYQKLEIEEYV